MRSLVLPLLAALAANRAAALPSPPSFEPRGRSAQVRVLLGRHFRFTVAGENLLLGRTMPFPGENVFHVRCATAPSGAAYVEFGAGRRSYGQLEISVPEGALRIGGKRYRGRVTVLPRGPSCLVVNALGLEDYIASVIGREMSASWPMEALKAQAVASRSYAIFQAQANRSRDFDLEGSTQDQAYDGMGSESARTRRAAAATKGLALVYSNSALKAYFHANCGGATEVPELVWGGEAQAFRPVICPYHRHARDRQTWSIRLSREQIEGALRRITGLLPNSFRRLALLEPGAPDASGRLSDLSLSDPDGNTILLNSNTFRKAVGNGRLKSTAFQIRKEARGYVFEGEGHGHGVGLCQVGARAMAEEGKSFREILGFYYPLAKIRPLL